MDYNEKKCVILLDEVSMMKTLEYNKILDEIEGFEDLGDMGRTEKFGSHALVIMVRGLYKNWKLPLSYFFTGSGVKGDTLVEIVKNCVNKLWILVYCQLALYVTKGHKIVGCSRC